MKNHVELTEAEAALAQKIEFDIAALSRPGVDGHEIYLENKKHITKLLKMLTDRGAIPDIRIKYFIDPVYNTSRLKGSWRDIFIRNGNKGAEIYEHPHFLPYFRFMLYGANLPPDAELELREAIGEVTYFSSGDLDNVRKTTRRLVRTYGKNAFDPEEVYKFAIDIGLSPWMARSLLDAANSVRK